MKILILHLSDIHLLKNDKEFIHKEERITSAIRRYLNQIEVLFIVITGDIAFSGKDDEYCIAIDFLTALQHRILKESTLRNIIFVVIPGNHDCDFESELASRQFILESISKNLENSDDPSIISQLTSIQNNFFNFMDTLLNEDEESIRFKIYRNRDFKFKNHIVRFNCFNSAWMSKFKETQGDLFFPSQLITEKYDNIDLSVSLIHHPFNWFESNNSRILRKSISKISDVILTGHEHDPVTGHINSNNGCENEYVEGGVLKGKENQSSFNILLIDLEKKKHFTLIYKWDNNLYKPINKEEWKNFLRGQYLLQDKYLISNDFNNYLSDPGANYTHPKMGKIKLEHIFIPPDLEIISRDIESKALSQVKLDGDKFYSYFKHNKKVIVVGKDKSGKTSICKTLFINLYNDGYIPLLLQGEQISTQNTEKLLQIIKKEFRRQYSDDKLEQFLQLNHFEKVIIIDDFNKIQLNLKGKNKVIEFIEKQVENVCIIYDELSQFEEFIKKTEKFSNLALYKKCEIKEFGFLLRKHLIKKWHTLGNEYDLDKEDLSYLVKKSENIVNTIIGKNLIPSFPFVVLMVLQNVEALTPSKNLAYGSLGYLYEFLITGSISLKSKFNEFDIDTKYSYLSEFSYYMFSLGKTSLTGDEIDDFHLSFSDKYDTNFDRKPMIKELLDAKIIVEFESTFSFKYSYANNYFVARYLHNGLQNNTKRNEAEKIISKMINNAYKTDNANIIIFLSFLSKDSFIVNEILSTSKNIYSNISTCDLAEDIQFLCGLSKAPFNFELSGKDPDENRNRQLKAKDEEERQNSIAESEKINEEEQTEEILKLNLAFKTLQIMGQTVRNFSGSLTGDIKLEIARECFCLGLRSLKKFYILTKTILPDLKIYIAKLIQEQFGINDKIKLENESEIFIYHSCLSSAYGIIKRISYAVGSENLSTTFKKILKETNNPATRMTDISIKLDHFKRFPKNEVINLSKELENNHFADTLLKQLVSEHFYLFYTNYKTRQAVCDTLQIEIKTSDALDTSDKKIEK